MTTALRRAAATLIPLALLSGCSFLPTDDPSPVVRGPLSTRPQQPLFLTNLALRPRAAATQPAGTWATELSVGHTSLFEVQQSGGVRAAFDGEVSRAMWRTRYGIDDATDIELELAAVYGSSGFLDRFIDDFHSLLLLPDGGRNRATRDQYEMRLVSGGETVYALEEDRVTLGDAPLVVTHRIVDGEDGGAHIALRAGVDLPLGSEARGTSNGHVDWGFGVLGQNDLGRWSLFWGADLIEGRTPDALEEVGIDWRKQVHAHAGSELRWNDSTSLFLQLSWTGPITRAVELEEINREILDIGLGAAWDLDAGARLRFSFHEDIVAATGKDLSVFLGLGWGF